ncbi:GD14309, partial [Drosophila simulans]
KRKSAKYSRAARVLGCCRQRATWDGIGTGQDEMVRVANPNANADGEGAAPGLLAALGARTKKPLYGSSSFLLPGDVSKNLKDCRPCCCSYFIGKTCNALEEPAPQFPPAPQRLTKWSIRRRRWRWRWLDGWMALGIGRWVLGCTKRRSFVSHLESQRSFYGSVRNSELEVLILRRKDCQPKCPAGRALVEAFSEQFLRLPFRITFVRRSAFVCLQNVKVFPVGLPPVEKFQIMRKHRN